VPRAIKRTVPAGILEVVVLDARAARAAAAGGADRLELVADSARAGLTPWIATFVEVSEAVDAPRNLTALAATARELRRAGATEFVLGFLHPDGHVDRPAVESILEVLDGCPWAFHRALDHARNRTSAWRSISGLPGLDQVLTAGSPTGVADGLATLGAEAAAGHAHRILAGGALHTGHIAPLLAAGVRAFHTGTGVRRDATWSTPVDPALVGTWRDHPS
jgi:copper homeostasis protein